MPELDAFFISGPEGGELTNWMRRAAELDGYQELRARFRDEDFAPREIYNAVRDFLGVETESVVPEPRVTRDEVDPPLDDGLMSEFGYLPHWWFIPPCPRCGDKTNVQLVVVGMPALPLPAKEEGRVRFVGCLVDEDTPEDGWWCPACELPFPWTYPFEWTLLVEEPWASMILDGHKTWELRPSSTTVRGSVGLTPTGSGDIAGTARLWDVHGPFSMQELNEHRDKHLLDDQSLAAYAAGGRLYAWEIRYAGRLEPPVSYEHPPGSVDWARLPRSQICEFCYRWYPPTDPYHRLCPEFPTGWDTPEGAD